MVDRRGRWWLGPAGAVVLVGVLVTGCTSGSGSAEVGPTTTFAAEAAAADVDQAVAAVAEVEGVGGPAGRCVELQLAADADLAAGVVSGGGPLPGSVVEVVAQCRVAAGFVDDFVAGVAPGTVLAGEQRRCVRDVYLGLTFDQREALTGAAFAPDNPGSAETAAELDARIDGCGIDLEEGQ